MTRFFVAGLVAMVMACGGPEQLGSPDPADAATAATLPDVSGIYTMNQYFIWPFDTTAVNETGTLLIAQSGGKITAVAALRDTVSGGADGRVYSGTIAKQPDGSMRIDLRDPNSGPTKCWSTADPTKSDCITGQSFRATLDASGNLKGECQNVWFLPVCEAIRRGLSGQLGP